MEEIVLYFVVLVWMSEGFVRTKNPFLGWGGVTSALYGLSSLNQKEEN
jgi:hypothetical protein